MDIQKLLKEVPARKASDLHIRSNGPAYIRVDGSLSPLSQEVYSAREIEEAAFALMTPRAKKLFNERQECDFSYQADSQARFRLNVFRQRSLLCLAIRMIPTKIPALESLRLPVGVIQKIASNRRGLVLVTGTAGSGKSTTLAAMVDYINQTRPAHIITIEDPIEYVHADKKAIISQRELGEDTSTYLEALRMVLRQDPDVVLVGEMRDLETTSAALTAAQTGHLVFATLHTLGAMETISRIVDLYPPYQQAQVRIQLADSLKAVISQRLLPASASGRIPSVEILVVTAHVKKLIEDNNTSGILQAMQKGAFYGMQTFNQSLVKLFKEGVVSEEEILAAASNPDDVKLAMRGIEQEIEVKR